MIEKVSEQNNNVNIKRLDSDYQDLIENIKGKFSSLSIIFMRSSRDLESARFFFKPGNLI